MVNLILYEILYKLNQGFCGAFNDDLPKVIGRQLDNGMVVSGEGEYQYSGITDQQGNYFYLRHLDRGGLSTFKQLQQKRCCGGSYLVTTKLRLVAVYTTFSYETVQYAIENEMMGLCIGGVGKIQAPKIKLLSAKSDFEQIYKEETGKPEARQADLGIRLTAVDFELTYRQQKDNCQDISLCCDLDFEQFCDSRRTVNILKDIVKLIKARKDGR